MSRLYQGREEGGQGKLPLLRNIHILNPRKERSVMGCELSLQLRLPCVLASAIVGIVIASCLLFEMYTLSRKLALIMIDA